MEGTTHHDCAWTGVQGRGEVEGLLGCREGVRERGDCGERDAGMNVGKGQ